MSTKILIIGACGQIGTELTHKLREIYGTENVIASDIRKLDTDVVNSGPFEVVNALDFNQIEHIVEAHQITDVYLMAALLSATAEKNPAFAYAVSPVDDGYNWFSMTYVVFKNCVVQFFNDNLNDCSILL